MNLESAKPNTKGYIRCDSIYMKSIYRGDKTTWTENSTIVNRGRMGGRGDR